MSYCTPVELNVGRVCGGRGGGVGGHGSTSSSSPVTPGGGGGGGGGRGIGGLVDDVRLGGGRGGGVGGGGLVAPGGESCPSTCVDVVSASSNDSLKPLSLRRLLLNALRRPPASKELSTDAENMRRNG